MIVKEKTNTQIISGYSKQNYKNQNKNNNVVIWYPTARPSKIWRKSGTSQHMNTSINNMTVPCERCSPDTSSIGLPFKMLGKNESGVNKLNAVTTIDSCELCDPTKGPVGTNSAGAKIRSAVTLLNKNYYTSNLSYLKARCKTYDTNAVLNKKDGITYFKNGVVVWPSDTSDNSAIYKTNCNTQYNECCNSTIYKPSNSQFSNQGAVSNSARLARVKYNTITKNNNELSKTYNVNFSYNGSQNNLYFIKNKTDNSACSFNNKQCSYKNRLRKFA